MIESDGENTNIDDGSDDVDYTKDYVYDDVQIDADEFVRPGKYYTDLTNEEIDALLPDDVTLVDVVFLRITYSVDLEIMGFITSLIILE